jgi:hypothetical protein
LVSIENLGFSNFWCVVSQALFDAWNTWAMFGYTLCCDYSWYSKWLYCFNVSNSPFAVIKRLVEFKIEILISARVQMDLSLEVVPDQSYHPETGP